MKNLQQILSHYWMKKVLIKGENYYENWKFAIQPNSIIENKNLVSKCVFDSVNKWDNLEEKNKFMVAEINPDFADGKKLCEEYNIDKKIESTKMILAEYQKYNKLTNYELECFPLFYDLANAMGILQISYLNSLGEISKEDEFWLTESEKGLSFSTPTF